MDELSAVIGIAVAVIGSYLCAFLRAMSQLGAVLLNGWSPLVFRCGSGRWITALRIGGLHFQFGLLPMSGFVHAAANSPVRFRVKWLFYALAGPAMTVGTIWGLWKLLQFVMQWATTPDWIPIAIGTLMLTQAGIFFGTVFPQMENVDGIEIPNDGMQVIRSITMSTKTIAEQYFCQQGFKAQITLERGDQERAREVLENACRDSGMDSLATCIMWIRLLSHTGRSEEANLAMTSAADNWHTLGKTRGEVLDSLASLPLFYGCGELQAQAMAYIDQAIAEEPEAITLKGTKGSLLVESGRSKEGLELLTEVLEHTKSENDRAICSYYIALAHSELGAWQKGFELLQEAVTKYPDCIVRFRVAKSFQDQHESAKASA